MAEAETMTFCVSRREGKVYHTVSLHVPATVDDITVFLNESRKLAIKEKGNRVVNIAPDFSLIFSKEGVGARWEGAEVINHYPNCIKGMSDYAGFDVVLKEGDLPDGVDSESSDSPGTDSEAGTTFNLA